MNELLVFALIALVHTAASAPPGTEEYIAEKCAPGDTECLTRGVKVFLKKISGGNPKLDIKPFDPVEIDHIKIKEFENNFEFKNVKITGFKEQDIVEFVIGKDTDELKTKVHLVADSTVSIKGEKVHEYPYHLKATVSGVATYPKEIKKHDDGKEYIILGEETITCEVEGNPEATISNHDDILADPALQSVKNFGKNVEETRKKIACALFKEAFKAVGSSMRKFLAVVPKEDLYKK